MREGIILHGSEHILQEKEGMKGYFGGAEISYFSMR